MATGKIAVERTDEVVVLRLDDAKARNAMSLAMADELRALLLQAETEARAVVLTGGDTAFCAGVNLTDARRAPTDAGPRESGARDLGLSLEHHFNPLMLTIRDLGVPLVTAVCGAAAGVGASLALMGDLVVLGRSAYFLQAFRHIALVPDGGSPWLLSRAIGRVRAMELMLLGDKLGAEQAFAWGMANRLVDDAAVAATALDLARRLAAGPAAALRLTRKLCWAAADQTFEAELRMEREAQREAGYHDDHHEGVRAFLEKRPARFGTPRPGND